MGINNMIWQFPETAGVLFIGVLIIRVLLVGDYIRAPDFANSHVDANDTYVHKHRQNLS